MSEALKAGGCRAPDGRAAQFAGEFAAVPRRFLSVSRRVEFWSNRLRLPSGESLGGLTNTTFWAFWGLKHRPVVEPLAAVSRRFLPL